MTPSTDPNFPTPNDSSSGYEPPKVEQEVKKKPEVKAEPGANIPEPKESDPVLDMYEPPKVEQEVKKEPEIKAEPGANIPEPKESPSGYGDPKAEPKIEPEVKIEPKDDAERLLHFEIDEAAKPLGDESEEISRFAKENKMSKEQVEAYVKLRQSQDAQDKTSREDRAKEVKEANQNELLKDKVFGGENGENFAQSVTQVNKVLVENMPNLNKALTDSKGMLPPYLMKDLLELSKILFSTETLIKGGPSIPEADEVDPLLIMYK